MMPRYPIYVPSKGRADRCLTARFLKKDGVPFKLVVEPQEAEAYRAAYGAEQVLVLPFRDAGSVVPARNWIKDHSITEGYARHWQLDDNGRGIWRRYRGMKISCPSGPALRVVEDFCDRYQNVAIAGLNYYMFAPNKQPMSVFQINCHVYSCCLVSNSIPYRWRGRYNEDTDLCLQALAGGWCTVLFNAFLIWKETTMSMDGGNTRELYHGDGRLKMARSLERLWPGVVKTRRRFRRPQHVVFDAWKRFDTPLRLKPGVDLGALKPNDYGLSLKQVKPIKSETIRALLR